MANWLRPLIPATRDQVLKAIVPVWRARVSNPRRVIDGECPLSKGFTPFDFDEIDMMDLDRVFDFFGSESATRAVMSRIRSWADSGSEPTFGEIAGMMASHLQMVDAQPLSALGRSCDSAGLFLALRTVAHEYAGKLIEPSDSIRRVFGRRGTRRFLERCAARLLDMHPRRGFLARMHEFGLLLGAFCALIGGAFLFGLRDVSLAFFGLAGMGFLLAWTASIFDDGLPAGVRTFRDLAKWGERVAG